jgi:hypothetical protein
MTWKRKYTLIGGMALILISNAVALLGVRYNRSGDPDSVLHLSQRELALPYWRGVDREGTMHELRLKWRTLAKDENMSYGLYAGQAEWLDRKKLEALGFDMSPIYEAQPGKRNDRRPISKLVYVALELDGGAYREALRRAQRLADKPAAQPDASVSSNSPAERLKREQHSESRLFAIDASLDPGELRNRYPDRTRYAIVRGRVHVYRTYSAGRDASPSKLEGYLRELLNDRISVPREFLSKIDFQPRHFPENEAAQSHLQVTLALGRRFEPWIVAASSTRN